MAILRSLLPAARLDLERVSSLPARVASEADAVFDRMVGSHVQRTAQSGPVRVSGSILVDRQSGGVFRATWDPVDGVGEAAGADMGPETTAAILGKSGDLIREGATHDFAASVAVQTYEASRGTGGYDLPSGGSDDSGGPVTITGETTFRITQAGAVGLGSTNAGSLVPTDRLHNEFAR